jgi:cation:H+ antiporter
MLLESLYILAGLALLVWSADRLVMGASSLAQILNVPLFFVGFLVVGVGTSAPEMVVAGVASFSGNGGLAVGNAIGSNIANMAMVLGATAIISPIIINRSVVKFELPLLFIFSFIAFYLLIDFNLSFLDGALFITSMVFALYIFFRMMPKSLVTERDPEILKSEGIEIPDALSLKMSIFWTVAGMILLIIGSKLLVHGAIGIAQSFGMSDLIIGLTIVAIGTSLPELTASIAAARQKKHELAFGNIIGSNMFNTLVVLAIPGLISPGDIPREAVLRDFSVALILTALLLVHCIYKSKRTRKDSTGDGNFEAINRWQGAALLILFFAYLAFVYLTSS